MSDLPEAAEMRAKWERYGERLKDGDDGGSLLGASFIIARSGVTDVLLLLDEIEKLRHVAVKAAGLVRTAHASEVGKREVVPQWWDGLKDALAALETEGWWT